MHDFTISVGELLGHPGAYRDLPLRVPLPGVQVPLARLEETPLRAPLRIESVMEGILVTGEATGDAALQCARCLTELRAEVSADLCELFYAPGHVPEGDQDSYRATATEIDLEPMLRDAMTLALPLNPLCRPDCKGLCARCGRDLNVGECDCVETETDPRWAALDALRDRLTTS